VAVKFSYTTATTVVAAVNGSKKYSKFRNIRVKEIIGILGDYVQIVKRREKMEWKKPYELKQKRFWMFYYKFEITFDETVIYQVIGGFSLYSEVKQLTNLLNAAYNLGYLEKQFEEEAKNATENSHL